MGTDTILNANYNLNCLHLIPNKKLLTVLYEFNKKDMVAFRIDSLLVKVYPSRKEMGINAASAVARRLKILLEQKEQVNMIFAAAPSQNELLQALVDQKGLDWNRVNAFHMDEYIGLPKDAPQSFGKFLKEKIFDQLSFKSVHFLNGNTTSPQQECSRYSDLLKLYPPDIVCMGIGENTHIAFNDPHVADFNDPEMVKIVSLDPACRQQQVNDGCFKEINQVPAMAITLTIPTLFSAKYIYCVVPGPNKANAVYLSLTEKISEKYPASILRKHGDGEMFLDTDSALRCENMIKVPV